MMHKILLVEDDKFTRLFMKNAMEDHHFEIIEAMHGKRLFEILNSYTIDLILLDINLPDGKGYDFIQKIREISDIPIIIVSGDTQKHHILKSLNRGADDYIQKPIDIEICVARVHANLRRYHNHRDNAHLCHSIKFGEWTFDPDQHQIFNHNNQSAQLTPQEFQLLDVFIKNCGKIMSREKLCTAICNGDSPPTVRAIDVKVTRIRKKIKDKDNKSPFIRTIHGLGYIFDTPIISL